MNTCSSTLPIREKSEKKNSSKPKLGGLGEMIQFDLRIFFKWVGEKPPTRKSLHSVEKGEGDLLTPFDNNGSLRLKKKIRSQFLWFKIFQGQGVDETKLWRVEPSFWRGLLRTDVIIGNLWEVRNNNCFVQFWKLHCSKNEETIMFCRKIRL